MLFTSSSHYRAKAFLWTRVVSWSLLSVTIPIFTPWIWLFVRVSRLHLVMEFVLTVVKHLIIRPVIPIQQIPISSFLLLTTIPSIIIDISTACFKLSAIIFTDDNGTWVPRWNHWWGYVYLGFFRQDIPCVTFFTNWVLELYFLNFTTEVSMWLSSLARFIQAIGFIKEGRSQVSSGLSGRWCLPIQCPWRWCLCLCLSCLFESLYRARVA